MYSWESVCLFDLTGMQSLPSVVPAVQRSRVVEKAVGLSSVTTVNSCGTQIRPATLPDSRELIASGWDPSDPRHSATARRAALLVSPPNTPAHKTLNPMHYCSGFVNYTVKKIICKITEKVLAAHYMGHLQNTVKNSIYVCQSILQSQTVGKVLKIN